MVKYIFVTGGVLSSVGKGVTASSIGKMLQVRGYNVTVIKIDPYVNVDAGTMNPFMHGEVFVTDDGSETDLNLGWYERFLDVSMTKDHYITTGQIYGSVIEKERRGEYLGKCVQIIPHITDEIKMRIRRVAEKTRADVVLTEIGGTTGDIEGLPFLEAARQLKLEEGSLDTLFVHVALVPILETTKEQKTKPLQHSVNELRRIGIQPDIIVARCSVMIEHEVKKKIALFANVEEKGVFCSPTIKCIYELPLIFDKQGMGSYICRRMGLPERKPVWDSWTKTLEGYLNPKYEVKVAMCGKYAKLSDSYISINEALRHAGATFHASVNIDWIETETFEEDPSKLEVLNVYDGILVPPGFGARGTEGKILAISYAREKNIPFLGICFGFQMAVVEFARNVCGLKDANSVENDPNTPHPVLDYLPEQKNIKMIGGTMRLGAHEIHLKHGTLIHKLYGVDTIYERHRHRFEVNPEYWEILEKNGLVFSGKSSDGRRIEVLEFPKNSFHVGTQFHPEFKSRPNRPSPVFYGFISACLKRKYGEKILV
ncbi:MAG: CTP synthetase [Candidatus Hecatellales archaeon]|nr:MAG: CTP synthetase [Candidatus Hecatellales archaeon]